MAWVTIPALIGPVVGPPLGGFITTYASWHWIFLINIPIGLLGIVLALTLHRSRCRPRATSRSTASACCWRASASPASPSACPSPASTCCRGRIVGGADRRRRGRR